MTYDPRIHHRRSIRLPHYNYAQPGLYFITICAYQRQCLFANISNGSIELTTYGEIVAEEWKRSSDIRNEIQLDTWVVMPNHFHGLVEIVGGTANRVGADGRTANRMRANSRSPQRDRMKSKSISSLISGFKSAVTYRINGLRQTPGNPVWQRNYYEHIVRNESECDRLRDYIFQNPHRWQQDQLHPDNPSKW
ncbi:transposase [Sodalinema gerasimenkoae]|uniref:transposase n=1 Tax=Sodalinema gerasimenkoae TaxID=2862348 RepID=UPI00135CC89B|nr:transposase [Sodalinema gerasimenkoae]